MQLVDSLNNPLSNKYVSAFTWPEYSFSETTNDYFIDPIKLGLLENAIIITDNEGYAKFKSLKFLGSSSSNIYIMFTCDGITSSVWSTKVNSFRITYGIP